MAFLQKDNNTLLFIEDCHILFSYNFNLEEKIASFKVAHPNSFHVFIKEKGISDELNLYCSLNEKNVVLNILKFIKYEYNETIVYELLSVLFQ